MASTSLPGKVATTSSYSFNLMYVRDVHKPPARRFALTVAFPPECESTWSAGGGLAKTLNQPSFRPNSIG
jgi:hypothetical protein